MNRREVEAAKREAQRFIERCDVLLASRQAMAWDDNTLGTIDWMSSDYDGGSRMTASVKRSSMDLTRALADLRRRA